MDDKRFGRAIRVLRQRRGWRQADLADRSELSRTTISAIERGRADRYTLATVRALLDELNASAELFIRWGAPGDLDRVLDNDHAAVARLWADLHVRHGWEIWPEASYSIFGERGRVDLLAYHPPTGTLEVVEIKTGVWDVQDTLGRLDAKVRLGPKVATQRQWAVRRVVGALVMLDGRTAHRRVADHASLFAGYATRGQAARAFVRKPTAAVDGLLAYVPLPDAHHGALRRAGQRSVRVNSSRRLPHDAPDRHLGTLRRSSSA